ncbi:MAG: zf-HC2 domain-containing protein [bacterium]
MPAKTTRTRNIGGSRGASCDELLALINEYVDGNVTTAACKELEGHLAKCNPCRVVVDNVRKTITLYRKDKPCELPAKFHKNLHALLGECWKKEGPGRKKRR